jgi:hypothetical protein
MHTHLIPLDLVTLEIDLVTRRDSLSNFLKLSPTSKQKNVKNIVPLSPLTFTLNKALISTNKMREVP